MCVSGGGQTEISNRIVNGRSHSEVNVSRDGKEEGVSPADIWKTENSPCTSPNHKRVNLVDLRRLAENSELE